MVLNQSVHEYGPCFQINSSIVTYMCRILIFFQKCFRYFMRSFCLGSFIYESTIHPLSTYPPCYLLNRPASHGHHDLCSYAPKHTKSLTQISNTYCKIKLPFNDVERVSTWLHNSLKHVRCQAFGYNRFPTHV